MNKTRIIKFRAWDKHNEVMREHFTVASEDGECFDRDYAEPEWKLMQYTGLKDKNGKEIYEGDIVKAQYNDGDKNIEFIDEVVWGYFDDCCVEGETWITKTDRWQKCIYYWKDELEVIGNVYENPELLLNAPVSNKETKE
jgi:uncharacterized phage protein (TIGR01671 family)